MDFFKYNSYSLYGGYKGTFSLSPQVNFSYLGSYFDNNMFIERVS
jgi:hypothetical protein